MSEWGPSYQRTDAGARQAAVRDALAHLFEASAGPGADDDTPGALDALHETNVEPYVELLALPKQHPISSKLRQQPTLALLLLQP